uniref:Ankyrin repeat and SOCS box containing 3 n=1 Tax=Cynoglossus semilaevis TaxID=244447 RepID=A0A3P8UN01_CYNSE
MDFTECYSDTVSRVAAAARSGDRRSLRKLILRGCSLDCRDNRGWTPLHEAAAAGSARCVQDIFHDFVNFQTHEGETACFLAAQRGHVSVVRLLLKAGADINKQTNDTSCSLFAAVDGGHRDVVNFLLGEGAEVNRSHTESCWTCLHQAVYKGDCDIVQQLVKVCNVEAPDDLKITPLFVAAQYGRVQCLRILIDAGANVNVQVGDLATPLLIASQEGHHECVDLLLNHGADPNKNCSNEWPQLPIHAAAEFGHIEVLRSLIPVTDRACDHEDDTVSPLYLAIYGGKSQSVELLLKEGFSPDAQDCSQLDMSSPLAFDSSPAPRRNDKTALKLQEVRAMLCVALNQVRTTSKSSSCNMNIHVDGEVLNYLLEFVNWSTLPAPFKHILDQRRAEKTWKPHPDSGK